MLGVWDPGGRDGRRGAGCGSGMRCRGPGRRLQEAREQARRPEALEPPLAPREVPFEAEAGVGQQVPRSELQTKRRKRGVCL